MLTLTIPKTELFDEATNRFIRIEKDQTIQLEHSLVSLQKWEARHHKPFLSKYDKTTEEIIDYIRCMTVTQNVDPEIYYGLTPELIRQVKAYIEDPMTGTILPERNTPPNGETPSAELIYYWMITLGIPFECKKWHLNTLLTLIQVCEIKNDPKKKKMSVNDILAKNRELNEKRKQALHTKG